MSKNYIGVEDFLCDETFLSWYFKTDVRAIRRWEQWIADNPASRHRVRQAVDFLSSLTLEEETSTREQISRSEKLLLEKIRKAGKKSPASVILFRRKVWTVWTVRKVWIAAASVVVLAVGMAGLYNIQRRNGWHTTYGEVTGNTLPDGTDVMVNADTRIRYSSGWTDGKDREVWLSGEAFFHVHKTPLKSRFIVHTEGFDIIVTGTRFNVISRKQKANVLLQEGSVLLQTSGGEKMSMTPGDFVELNHHHLEKRTVRGDSVVAWKEHKLFFDSTSLKEVVAIIKEQYGVTVRLADEAVGDKTCSGIMPNDNLDVLLKALETTAEFRVIRHDSEIILRDHQQ